MRRESILHFFLNPPCMDRRSFVTTTPRSRTLRLLHSNERFRYECIISWPQSWPAVRPLGSVGRLPCTSLNAWRIDSAPVRQASFAPITHGRGFCMLALTRKIGEKLHVGNDITIEVRRVTGNRVTLSIDAPRNVCILRSELRDAALKLLKGKSDECI